MDSRNIGNFQNVSRETHFTPGFEAKGWGKSCDPIGWELKANPQSFRLGVKANNQLNILIYKILALRWSPRHKKVPSWIGGSTSHKEPAWASKELKYWLSCPKFSWRRLVESGPTFSLAVSMGQHKLAWPSLNNFWHLAGFKKRKEEKNARIVYKHRHEYEPLTLHWSRYSTMQYKVLCLLFAGFMIMCKLYKGHFFNCSFPAIGWQFKFKMKARSFCLVSSLSSYHKDIWLPQPRDTMRIECICQHAMCDSSVDDPFAATIRLNNK